MKAPRGSHWPLLVAVVAFLVWRESIEAFGGRGQLQEETSLALSGLAGNEAIFYIGVAVAQAFFIGGLGLWLARRWSGLKLDAVARRLVAQRGALAGVAIAGALAAFVVAVLVVRKHTTTEDEKTYLFQAKLLLKGRLWVDVPQAASPLWQPFIVRSGSHWSGQYFWAQPALLAIGLAAHAVYAVPAIEVACAVLFTGLLVEELSSDRRAGLFAAMLVAMSPIVILTGATLLNATLSAACAAVSLWGLARLHKGSDRAATWALGLSTAVGLHNRSFDHLVLMLAAACVLAVAHFRAPLAILRRLLPAIGIALPFIGLHFLMNKAISGDWRHSGYWLYYAKQQGLIMMGFGPGMGGFDNTVPVAVSKTLANTIRMAFYTAGTPFVFAPLAWALARSRGVLRAGAWIAASYYGAYLVYASASITTTGPVYFDALVPVLAGCAALAAVQLHDAVRQAGAPHAIVPGLALASMIGGLCIFWPSALLEVKRAATDSGACDDIAATLDPNAPALVFVAPHGSTHRSWTYWKPIPSPTLDDRILFSNVDGVADNEALVARYGPGRAVYLAHCVGEATPKIEHYDAATGRAWPIAGR